MQRLEIILDAADAAREGIEQSHLPVEGVQRHGVVRIALLHQGAQKLCNRRGFIAQILAGGRAGVDQERNGKGLRGLMLEHANVLHHAVILDGEIGAVEQADQVSSRGFHRDQQTHQANIDFERRLLRAEGGHAEKQREVSQCPWRFHKMGRALTTESSHSPSTQTSPSTKYSFFQTGTRRFSRLMPSSAASNAGLRCGAVTTTMTLVSLISRRPSRCTMAMRPMAWERAISPPISAIILTAMGS